MSSYSRVLVKIKVEEDSLPLWLCTFGSEPKLCTGYKDQGDTYYIPIDSLVKQGISIDDEFKWEEVAKYINGQPCLWFFKNEVEVLVN